MDWTIACDMVGRSAPFRRALDRIERFSRCDGAVLVVGETGTGKELAARAVHYLSPRRAMPFVPVNCGALPDTLVESELFGYARGAFTDARAARQGLVRRAHGGSLFLDEIETLSAKGQVILLRFLQDHVVRALGSDDGSTADVRIISASNVPLESLVERGAFRADLLFRLDVLAVRMPSLQERREDIVQLAEHFLERVARESQVPPKRLTPRARELLESAPWRGNIRQLENCLMRAQLLSDGDEIDGATIDRAHGALTAPAAPPSIASYREAKAQAIESFERAFLATVLRSTNGNIAEAARICNKERSAMSRLVAKHRPHLNDVMGLAV